MLETASDTVAWRAAMTHARSTMRQEHLELARTVRAVPAIVRDQQQQKRRARRHDGENTDHGDRFRGRYVSRVNGEAR